MLDYVTHIQPPPTAPKNRRNLFRLPRRVDSHRLSARLEPRRFHIQIMLLAHLHSFQQIGGSQGFIPGSRVLPLALSVILPSNQGGPVGGLSPRTSCLKIRHLAALLHSTRFHGSLTRASEAPLLKLRLLVQSWVRPHQGLTWISPQPRLHRPCPRLSLFYRKRVLLGSHAAISSWYPIATF